MFREKKGYFSIFWFFILVLGVIWLFTELGYIEFELPWLPIILIVFSLGVVINKLIGR